MRTRPKNCSCTLGPASFEFGTTIDILSKHQMTQIILIICAVCLNEISIVWKDSDVHQT